MELASGALFFEKDRISWHLIDPKSVAHQIGRENHNHGGSEDKHEAIHFLFQSVFVNANPKSTKKAVAPRTHFRNYIRGNDPSQWSPRVQLYQQLSYINLYQGIDVTYYGHEDYLKYDFIVHPGADPKQIITKYTENISVYVKNNELILDAPTGELKELKPYAYQIVNGRQEEIPCHFVVEDQKVSFKLGSYDQSKTLVIDPQIVFSSYTGSTADNWGFTATYDKFGNLYGGGIVFEVGYPVTSNNIQSTFNRPPGRFAESCDIGLSVFDPSGASLLYSTYIGGADYDQPQSMIVNSKNELVIYGTTGSSDFPIPSNGFETTHKKGPKKDVNGYEIVNGADIFIIKLNQQGNSIIGGTFLGGTQSDGPNFDIYSNYGDLSRGEVVVDNNDDIYVASSSNSSGFPTTFGVSQPTKNAGQDAVVFKLNDNLTNLIWSTFYGGSGADAGYSLKVNTNGDVYVCGGTRSTDLANTSGALHSSIMGGTDGFIARFDGTTGVLKRTTYIGTPSYDQTFLLDNDKFGSIYVFGQTKGSYPISANTWTQGSGQFIHKLSRDLSSTGFSTMFGSTGGTGHINIVPTAFNIDDCLNILLSGWGGITNTRANHNGGNTHNMPLTNNAYQSTTDGSDFYFLVLTKNAQLMSYATYFGGNSQEHVDGGTSRFSQDGVIYQAVCAGCGQLTFPTTPGAYSRSNGSSNCNLGVIKVDFDIFLKSDATINWSTDVDTNCNTLNVKFTNMSQQADAYLWDFGNGTTSTDVHPTTSYNTFGKYTVALVAFDTICDVTDTAYLTIDHNKGVRPKAEFEANYVKCDLNRTVSLRNNSRKGANQFIWNFGDGNYSNLKEPAHSYQNPGDYMVTLIAIDSTCGASDTAQSNVSFDYDIPQPIAEVKAAPCGDGSLEVFYENDSTWYAYEWEYSDGTTEKGKYPKHKFGVTGTYSVNLTIKDTLCNTEFFYSFNIYLLVSENRLYIPNAFTPNGDKTNEFFEIKGNSCLKNSEFVILNSYGEEVFKTNDPFNVFWDGKVNDMPAQQDVYVYRFTSNLIVKTGYIVLYY